MLMLLLNSWKIMLHAKQDNSSSLKGVLEINTEGDIVLVRKTIRDAARVMGFGSTDVTRIVTASSELARNIFKYAGSGRVNYSVREEQGREGIAIEFIDSGPGIPDLEMAMMPGYSSAKGLGMGLPGSKRLMDSLKVKSKPGEGTTVTVVKWQK